jgi:GT2 family glycosyltransferase
MPAVSVIIISLIGGKALRDCLASLGDVPGECLVFVKQPGNDCEALKRQFPKAKFLDRDHMSVPQVRARGVELATGKVVALLEDTSLPGPDWHATLAKALEGDQVVGAGGPVGLAPSLGARYLALGCSEYGRFFPDRCHALSLSAPDQDGRIPAARIPGNNLAYQRSALLQAISEDPAGLVESEVNQRLKQRGGRLVLHPGMAVTYAARDTHGARLKTRFQHGRLYAARRVAGLDWSIRAMGLLKSLLLPVVLTARACQAMTTSVRWQSWPTVSGWVALLETAWACGEAMGCIRGAGKSLEDWV